MDKDFKSSIINIFKELNKIIFKGIKRNMATMSYQEYQKEILKRSKQIILQLKATITKKKISLEGLENRFCLTEERLIKLDIFQRHYSVWRAKEKELRKWTESQRPEGHQRAFWHTHNGNFMKRKKNNIWRNTGQNLPQIQLKILIYSYKKFNELQVK